MSKTVDAGRAFTQAMYWEPVSERRSPSRDWMNGALKLTTAGQGKRPLEENKLD